MKSHTFFPKVTMFWEWLQGAPFQARYTFDGRTLVVESLMDRKEIDLSEGDQITIYIQNEELSVETTEEVLCFA